MTPRDPLLKFFKAGHFAVLGASPDPSKYGNKVFKWYLNHSLPVTGINPSRVEVYQQKTVASLEEAIAVINLTDAEAIKEPEFSVSVITPPKVSTAAIKDFSKLGPFVKAIWFQPGR